MSHCAECGIATLSIPEHRLCRGCEVSKYKNLLKSVEQALRAPNLWHERVANALTLIEACSQTP
jgi:hypothetical protein